MDQEQAQERPKNLKPVSATGTDDAMLSNARFYDRASKILKAGVLTGVSAGVLGTILYTGIGADVPQNEEGPGPVPETEVDDTTVPEKEPGSGSPDTTPDAEPEKDDGVNHQVGEYERSLPRVRGTLEVPGLSAPVVVERDLYGLPHIHAATYEDAVLAQGFVHAQERYFQMDVSRRRVKGNLSELLGDSAVPSDMYFRRLELEAVAKGVVERMSPEQRKVFEQYTAGVNAGLKDLQEAQPEYGWLKAEPEAWQIEDSVCVYLAVFYALHDNASYEKRLMVMQEALPKELYEFLTLSDSRFEHHVISKDTNYRYTPASIPGAEVINVRQGGEDVGAVRIEGALPVGSNNWAIAGKHTHDGEAIVANDPHLTISAPNIWIRSHLSWGDSSFVNGVSVSGTPGITIGSNGKVAWGFTNTTADFQDLIVIEVDPERPGFYKTPDGPEAFQKETMTIRVHGKEEPVTTEVLRTRWGIVVDQDHHGRPLVMEWTGRHAEMINMNVVDLNHAKTLDEAYKVAASWYGPSLNTVIADTEGDIAWVVSGYLPKREGYNGTVPVSRADGVARWNGALPESMRPGVKRPEAGVIVTANSRIVDPEWSATLGNHWGLGIRTHRIHQLLDGVQGQSEKDSLQHQLDTRTILFDTYRDIALKVLAEKTDAESLRAYQILKDWDGKATATSPALRILDGFRGDIHQALLSPLLAPCNQLDPSFFYHWPLAEESVLRLIETEPMHMLSSRYSSYQNLYEQTLSKTLHRLQESGSEGLLTPWGEVNQSSHRHLLSGAMPDHREVLDFPSVGLSGHWSSVRVNTPQHGASMRMVVSPGQEEEALLQMPGGQSGHPWSAHYRDGHTFWLQGSEQPLLPGEQESSFSLLPQRLSTPVRGEASTQELERED